MFNYAYASKLLALKAKGGMMYFTIIKPSRVYRGLVIVSAEKDNHTNRDVFIREFTYNQITQTQGGANETPSP